LPGIEAEPRGLLCDFRLLEMLERRVHGDGATLAADLGGDAGKPFETQDEFRAAIGVSRIVQRIDPDIEVVGPGGFRPGKGERQEHQIARRHIGDRDIVGKPILGHVDRGGQGRAAELVQVQGQDHMPFHLQARGDHAGRIKFHAVALVVIDRQGQHAKALFLGECCADHGIEAARQQDHGQRRRRCAGR
jgi:hypothetical protein